jgi:DNA polymerase
MRWSDRQQAMLREMGLRLWLPPQRVEPGAAAQAPAGTVVAAPAPLSRARLAPVPAPAEAAEAVASRPPAPITRPMPAPVPAPATQAPVDVAAAASAETATLDWPALRVAVEGCRACALCETRRHTVFGVGHERAHLMIVGEAPGEQEDLRGEPFVGPAGQLLDRMLQALGLTRGENEAARQVFIANTLKCRPPRNRNPTPDELAACQPFLQRQVALVQPRVILAMGRFAVQSLLASDAPIGRLRGQVHAWRGVPLVVTYHPAYLLRQPADKAKAWDDLCLAAQHLDAPAG